MFYVIKEYVYFGFSYILVPTMQMWRKDLIQSVNKTCKEEEILASIELIDFLLQLIILNPDYQNNDGKIDMKCVATTVVDKLRDGSEITLIIVKMQLCFMKHYETREQTINKHRQKRREKTKPLIKEICETGPKENHLGDQKLYYQKIMIVITLLSGLGKPTSSSILREVERALQSIFPPSELSNFFSLSCTKKEEYLIELMCIAAGMRIFKKDCAQGGEGIEDLPDILEKVVTRTGATIVVSLEDIMSKIYKYTTAAEQFLPLLETETKLDDGKECFFTKVVTKLTSLRQQEFYLRKILTETETSKKQIKHLLVRLRERMLQLHETVLCTSAVSTSQLYPQFVDLADIWLKLQDEVIVLSQINNFLLRLQSLCVTVNFNGDSELDDVIQGVDILTDVERFQQNMGKIITKCGECQVLYPNETVNFDKLKLEFQGFCLRTFVTGRGVLIPGNPNLGVIEWEGKHFVFASRCAAQRFGEDPNKHISDAYNFIRKRPEFIHLFQIYDTIEQLSDINEIVREHEAEQQNREIQTDVHILQPYIDKNYSSSLWEHRRRALKLVKIFESNTKSTQTIRSHFRKEFEVQVGPPENKAIQTRIDDSTNSIRIVNYIPALRGRACDNQSNFNG